MNDNNTPIFTFANKIIAIASEPNERVPDELAIARDEAEIVGRRSQAVSYTRSEKQEPVRADVFDLGLEGAKSLAGVYAGIELEFRSAGKTVSRGRSDLWSVKSDEAQDFTGLLRATAKASVAVDRVWAALLDSALDGRDGKPTLLANIDHVRILGNAVMLIHGWVANGPANSPTVLVDELRIAFPTGSLFFSERPDVSEHLGALGVHVRTPLHGVTLLAEVGGEEHSIAIATTGSGGVEWLSPNTRARRTSNRLELLRDVAALDIERFHDFFPLADLLRRTVGRSRDAAPVESVVEFRGSERRPQTSIVIPFYRDDYFLIDHIESQRRATGGYEWLFVCDDPGLLKGMRATLGRRERALRQPTRLIELDRNAGFGAANNVGSRHARGDYVVFMNSDVYCASFRPIDYAIGLMRDDPQIGAAGFVLHYEDGSLQHDGMHLEAAADLDGLSVAAHQGKGLPSRYRANSELSWREVEAVTAALLVVRKSDFESAVFDESYIVGDFEDYDLCQQVRARGKTIALVETADVIHLERQSIGKEQVQRIATYVNCITFNEKWGIPRGGAS